MRKKNALADGFSYSTVGDAKLDLPLLDVT